MNNARFIIQVSKGLIRHQHARRTLMFYTVLIALVLLFAGATFFWPFLRAHPLVFIGYWAVCGWITLLAVLLAIYDMVSVRSAARAERRRIEKEFLTRETGRPHDDPDAR